VKEAGKKPSYTNTNTPKTRTIQIVNPFYYYSIEIQSLNYWYRQSLIFRSISFQGQKSWNSGICFQPLWTVTGRDTII